MTNTIYKEYAVRLYINTKFGKQIGPARTNKFQFNGSVSFRATEAKFFVDLADLDNLDCSIPGVGHKPWRDLAYTVAQQRLGYTPTQSQDLLGGLLFELGENGKEWTQGLLLLNVVSQKGYLFLMDQEGELLLEEDLRFRGCRVSSGKGTAPDLLATNYDVTGGNGAPRSSATPTPTDAVLAQLAARSQP